MKNIIIMTMLLMTACANHKYILYDSDKPNEKEDHIWKSFVVLGIIPVENDLNQKTVCPGQKIRSLNMYDSVFDGVICGATFLVFCPHTVGVECVDANPVNVPMDAEAKTKKNESSDPDNSESNEDNKKKPDSIDNPNTKLEPEINIENSPNTESKPKNKTKNKVIKGKPDPTKPIEKSEKSDNENNKEL